GRLGGKLSFCSSYSGNSNSPVALQFLIGMLLMFSSPRETTTTNSLLAAAPAAVILRIVVATPFTSSSVSVNHARLQFFSATGISPVNSLKMPRSHFREGAWL